MAETIREAIDRLQAHAENLVYQATFIEDLKNKIAAVSDFDFAEKVATITSAKANTYTTCVQVERMRDALHLLMFGIDQEVVISLLEDRREGCAIDIIERRLNDC